MAQSRRFKDRFNLRFATMSKRSATSKSQQKLIGTYFNLRFVMTSKNIGTYVIHTKQQQDPQRMIERRRI